MTDAAPYGPAGAVPDYLVQSVLVTVCFPLVPVGLVAIFFALRGRRRERDGDEAGAHHDAMRARRWAWAALIAGLAFFVALMVIYIGMAPGNGA